MKVSIFSNDKSTVKDELFLSAYAIICFVIGVILMTVPFFKSLVILGAILAAQAVIFVPCIIYRFMTNDKISKHE